MLNGSLLALEADSHTVQTTYRAHLVQTLAEAELRRKSPDAPARAQHVLCWLGCGGPFVPFKPSKGGPLSGASNVIHPSTCCHDLRGCASCMRGAHKNSGLVESAGEKAAS